MSISYKKINSMIEEEVNNTDDLTDKQKESLILISKQIYMLESSLDSISRSKLLSDIRGRISMEANSF